MTVSPVTDFEWRTWGEITPELHSAEWTIPFASAGWKYLLVAASDSTDRSAVDFDDSGWNVGAGPFGVGSSPFGPAPVTAFPLQGEAWIRRDIEARPGVPILVGVRYDNIVAVWWNGVQVYAAGTNDTQPAQHFIHIAGDDVEDVNVIAVRVTDDADQPSGDSAYLDVQVAQSLRWETYAATAEATQPVSWWRLGEASGLVATDEMGLHPGTYVGGPTLDQASFPGGGKGVLFGSGKYVSIGNVLSMGGTKLMSVVAWVKLPAGWGGGGSFTPLISKGNNAWRLGRNGTTSGIQWNLAAGTTSATVSNTTPVDDGAWHMCVGTYDGNKVATDRVRLYIDAVLVGTNTASGVIPTTADPVRIASRSDSAGLYIPGMVDEVKVYDRELSAVEIAELYAVGMATQGDGALPDEAPPAVPAWVVNTPRSDALATWAILGYGRADGISKTTPVQVTVNLSASLTGTPPEIGERFRLTLSDDAAAELGIDDTTGAVRFTGEVTDVVHPRRGKVDDQYVVTGVGRLGRSSRRTLTTFWPRETDGQRAERILEAAGVEVGTVEDGGRLLLAQLEAATLAELMDIVSDSAGGTFIEQLTGEVDYHARDHRRGSDVVLDLTDAEILNDLTWTQSAGAIVNEIEVAYGNPASRITVRDRASIRTYDAWAGSLTTRLVERSDAHAVGGFVVAARRKPSWQLPALQLDLRRYDGTNGVAAAKRAALLGLKHGDRILVSGLPEDGPYTGAVEFFVEGIAETATRTAWRLAIAVADPELSGADRLRWQDVNAGLEWDEVLSALSWRDVALITDPDELGA